MQSSITRLLLQQHITLKNSSKLELDTKFTVTLQLLIIN